MGKTIYIDVELEKKKVIKQMKDLEKELKASIKRAEKNARFVVNLDKKWFNKTVKDINKTKISPKIDNTQIQTALSNIKNDIQKVARDNWKPIDVKVFKNLQSNITDTKIRLKELKAVQKQVELSKWPNSKEYKKLDIEIDNVSSSLTEAKRRMNNLKNTWDVTTSRLQKKFDKVSWGIRWKFWWALKYVLWFLSIWAVIQFWKQLFKLWSDAEEIWSKFNTVFKWIEEKVSKTFDKLADDMWRSRLEIKKFWSDLWDVLKPLWFLTQEAADLSAEMVQLAIDVASFNNVSDEQAINAFRSALTWEREALKTLGIVINEADVKQEALNRWLIKQWEELSKQDKALATYSLLLQNTADAQWDAIRTAWSFANQLKRLGWVITDTFAEAWKEVAQDTASWLWDIAIFVKTYWIAFIKTFIEIAKSIGSAFKPIFDLLQQWFNGISKLLWNSEKETKSWGDIFLFVLNSISTWFKFLWLLIKSSIVFWKELFAGLPKIAISSWKIIIWAFKLVWIAIWDVFLAVPRLMERWIKLGLNKIIENINKWIKAINKIPWVDIGEIGFRFDAPSTWLFDSTVWEFNKLKNEAENLWWYVTNVSNNISKDVKGFALDFVDSVEKSNKKIKESVKTTEQIEAEDAEKRKKRIDDMFKKYWELWEWNKKVIEETAKAQDKFDKAKAKIDKEDFEKQIKNIDKLATEQDIYNKSLLSNYKTRVKAIEELSKLELWEWKEAEKMYEEVNDKIIWYKNDLKDITVKIFEEEEKSLKKLSESIEKLQDEAKKITEDKDTSIAERKLEIEKERKEILEDIAKLDNSWSLWNASDRVQDIDKQLEWDLSESKRNRLLEKRADLLEKINTKILNANSLNWKAYDLRKKLITLSDEEGLVDQNLNSDSLQKAKSGEWKTKTDKILDKYEEEKEKIEDKLQVQLDALETEWEEYNKLVDLKTKWEQLFTWVIVSETNKRIWEQARLLDDARRVAAEMAALWFNWKGFTASFKKTDSETWKTTTVNRTINITNNNKVDNSVDLRKQSRQQAKQIARAEASWNTY